MSLGLHLILVTVFKIMDLIEQSAACLSVVYPALYVSDPTPDLDPTFKEVSTPDPYPDPVSDPATLVSASRELGGKLALYS